MKPCGHVTVTPLLSPVSKGGKGKLEPGIELATKSLSFASFKVKKPRFQVQSFLIATPVKKKEKKHPELLNTQFFLLAMVSIENIEFLFPSWLISSLHSINHQWETCLETFKNYQAVIMRRASQAGEIVRQAMEFIHNHPVIGVFLAVVAVLGFIPILAFLTIVSGSFVIIFVTALTMFQGVVVISLAPFLTVLVPILMIGGTAAVFTYTVYRSFVKILQIIKRVIKRIHRGPKEIANHTLPSRINGKPIRFRSYKVKPPAIPYAFPPNDEEPFEEELFYSSPNWF
ncbi:hypothetical protein ACROYT_G018378 [Oculina patagonica]